MTTLIHLGAPDVRRIRLFTWGEVRHPKGNFTVDRAFFAALDEHRRDMAAQGYFIPTARKHVDDGYTYGRLLAIYATDEGIDGDIEFARGMAERFDAGYLNNWSPSFYQQWEDPHTGKVYAYALREISFVTVPHQKNLPSASPHYALSESGWVTITTRPAGAPPQEGQMATTTEQAPVANAEGEEEEGAPSMEQRMGSMEKKFSELTSALKPMMDYYKANMDGDDEDEPAESGDAVQNGDVQAAFAARVGELERENARLDIVRRLGEGVEAKRVEHLTKLRLRDRALYESTVTELAEARQRVASTEPAPKTSPKPTALGAERGTPQAPPTPSGKTKIVQLAEKAKADGHALGSGGFYRALEDGGIPMSDYTADHADAAAKVYGLR